MGQMKAVVLPSGITFHGQHEHKSLLYRINSWKEFWMHMVKMNEIYQVKDKSESLHIRTYR